MDDEKIISGYCRQIDRSRMVTVELESGKIQDVDCLYDHCIHRPNCPIARQIDAIE